jgi:hypothetical protein
VAPWVFVLIFLRGSIQTKKLLVVLEKFEDCSAWLSRSESDVGVLTSLIDGNGGFISLCKDVEATPVGRIWETEKRKGGSKAELHRVPRRSSMTT